MIMTVSITMTETMKQLRFDQVMMVCQKMRTSVFWSRDTHENDDGDDHDHNGDDEEVHFDLKW